uniref:Uncharacterized protein n=1 Tax=Anguilla anguilla TaxID=7936 RepID=A0A0E9XSN5_ANGAN
MMTRTFVASGMAPAVVLFKILCRTLFIAPYVLARSFMCCSFSKRSNAVFAW